MVLCSQPRPTLTIPYLFFFCDFPWAGVRFKRKLILYHLPTHATTKCQFSGKVKCILTWIFAKKKEHVYNNLQKKHYCTSEILFVRYFYIS